MQMIGLANNNIYNIIPSSLKTNGNLTSFNTMVSRQDWWVDKIDSRKKPMIMTVFVSKANITSVYDSGNKDISPDGSISDILDKISK